MGKNGGKWWKIWYMRPFVFVLFCLPNILFRPLSTIGQFCFYNSFRRGEFPPSKWTIFVSACTDIDIS